MTWDPIWNGPRIGEAWIEYSDGHPVAELLGLKTLASADGEVTFSLAETPRPNPNGSVHGGLLAAALDHVLAIAGMTAMADDALPSTTGMNVQYLRPAIPELKLVGRVTRAGKSFVFVRAEVFSSDGQLCATADGTFAVVTPSHVNARA